MKQNAESDSFIWKLVGATEGTMYRNKWSNTLWLFTMPLVNTASGEAGGGGGRNAGSTVGNRAWSGVVGSRSRKNRIVYWLGLIVDSNLAFYWFVAVLISSGYWSFHQINTTQGGILRDNASKNGELLKLLRPCPCPWHTHINMNIKTDMDRDTDMDMDRDTYIDMDHITVHVHVRVTVRVCLYVHVKSELYLTWT
jgi:hypothetical protein